MDIHITKKEWKDLCSNAIRASSLIEEAYNTPRQRNTARVLRKTIRDITRKNNIE